MMQLQFKSEAKATGVAASQHATTTNIYSTILAGIQNNLTLRKTQSEDASIVSASGL